MGINFFELHHDRLRDKSRLNERKSNVWSYVRILKTLVAIEIHAISHKACDERNIRN